MKHFNRKSPVLWVLVSLFLFTPTAFAQGKSDQAPGKLYGLGQPKSEQDLPPGQLRKSIEGLPLKARAKALKWLQGFSFPAEDIKHLRVDNDGSVLYADMLDAESEPASYAESTGTGIEAADPNKVFRLHSRPGSNNVVYLDFDGHVLENTAWNYYLDDRLVALPFDPSNNDNPPTEANFTQDELNRIAEIWHRMAEDFAAFDVDITTEEPSVFTNTTGRVLFTHDTDADGKTMPSQNAGGVAYVNVFGWSNYSSYYSPALVYYTNLYTNNHGYPTLLAEAGSHELGHNLGLSHDGVTGGSTYYSGHGSGLTDWAPIMGSGYSRNITQWSKGEYPGANNPEDDIAIIAEDLSFVGDDHGNSAANATALAVDSNGAILASSPELDPDNVLSENKGVIDDENDVDWFYFDATNSGPVEITVTPAWHSFTRSDLRGSNLDIELALFDSGLSLVAYDEPENDTFAEISTNVSSGRYYLQINGISNDAANGYSDYASTGMFFIEGTVPLGDTNHEDTTPPSPAQMSWESTPTATGTSSIAMMAVTATDESGGIEYYFSCVAGGTGCTDSGWQSSSSYTADGLQEGTYYSYKVKARDVWGNENGSSVTMGATTDATPEPPPVMENESPVAVATYTPDPAVISKGNNVEVTLNGSASYDPDGSISDWLWTLPGNNVVGSGPQVTVRLKEGTYTYTLTVTDNNGKSAAVTMVIPVSKSGGGDDSGTGKGKPPRKK
jgi:hypothetical protein